MKSKDNAMTEGPIFKRLTPFALPLMAVNLLQVFYNFADMMIVGMSAEADAVGAIGTTMSMINLIVNSFIGLSVGASVTLAQSIGAGKYERSERIVHTSLVFSIMLGVVACAVGLGISRLVLTVMGNRGKLLELSIIYSRIYFLGLPFLSITNFASALHRASGDSKSPLFVLGISGSFNLLANIAFIKIFSMSVDGVALATLLANLMSAILLIIGLTRLDNKYNLRLSRLGIDKQALFSIARVGIPAGLLSAIYSFSHMVTQSSILTVNNLNVGAEAQLQPVVKGCSAATSIESFSNTVVNAVGQTAITFVGQNAGARRYDRIGKIRFISYLSAFFVAAVSAGTVIILREPLLGLFGIAKSNANQLMQLAYDSAETRILIMMIPYMLLAFMEIGTAILQGLSKTLTAAIISIVGSVVFRMIWIGTVFAAKQTLAVIFLSFPLSWFITGTLLFLFGSRELSSLANPSRKNTTE